MMTEKDVILLISIVPILLIQSTWLFIDAKKRGGYAWFWGIWGLIQAPMPTIFYLIFVIWLPKKRQQKLNK